MRNINRWTIASALVASLVVSTGASVASASDPVDGAGSTWSQIAVDQWRADVARQGLVVNYQGVGSTAGRVAYYQAQVDFAVSEIPFQSAQYDRQGNLLADETQLAASRPYAYLPIVAGGTAFMYNLKANGQRITDLRLSPTTVAKIFTGQINMWNDPAIVALNPGVNLPAVAIAPVRRADGSGTSFLFTHYLSQVSPDWKAKVGEGTAVNWPTGAGGKGNEGVAAFVQRLPNSIGYVEYAYAKQNKMSHVLMLNRDGVYVAPDDATFKAAAANAQWAKSFNQVLTNQPGKDSWPITGATFILMHAQSSKPTQTAAALKFFDWAFTQGDGMAADLEYVALPDPVKALVRKAWTGIK